MFDPSEAATSVVDPKDAADSAGLRYVSDARPGISRRKAGTGFSYLKPDGERVTDPDVLMRIKTLAIPPAWTDVWICPFADGHIQATGRDAKGRKQYKYHEQFREVRESGKYEHIVAFADALPGIRKTVGEHMKLRGLPREKVLATVVASAGDDADPRRQRRLRQEEQELRPDHPEEPPRRGERLGGALPLHRQERQAMVAEGAGPPHRQDHPAMPGSAGAGADPVRRRRRQAARCDVERRQRLPARNLRPRHHREGFPHLGGHGARGAGAEPVRGVRQHRAGQAQSARRDRAGRRAARQHADDLPQVLRPPRDHQLVSRRQPGAGGQGRAGVAVDRRPVAARTRRGGGAGDAPRAAGERQSAQGPERARCGTSRD